jgi:hypothetical protein
MMHSYLLTGTITYSSDPDHFTGVTIANYSYGYHQ